MDNMHPEREAKLHDYVQLMGFAPGGWGRDMLAATGLTVAIAVCGFLTSVLLGALGAAALLSHLSILRAAGRLYTMVLRGIPDLLVIYLFYFGSSQLLALLSGGSGGFIGAPSFLTGVLAIGVVAGAYQAQIFRGAVQALSKGEIEAARAYGMSPVTLFRRIVLPQAVRHAIPGSGNIWQLVLKESALISVIGLVELMRQAQIGAGSTRQPFSFFLTAAALYLVITFLSGIAFRSLEARATRGIRKAV
ncbi:ABC transporter permease subunit [Azospirillum sp. A29]|jgi:octopine/nopaline transport system permease protein|uniref:ABC transporter permease n=1 Tax=Azospirillum sp. A29 TaxID=3160606 RepID=UPI00366EF32B